MPKYNVYLQETVTYQFEVEAESEDDLHEAAEDYFLKAANHNDMFHDCHDRHVKDFKEIPEKPDSPT